MLFVCFHLSGFEQSDRFSRNLDLINWREYRTSCF